jgi:hypothetical protein
MMHKALARCDKSECDHKYILFYISVCYEWSELITLSPKPSRLIKYASRPPSVGEAYATNTPEEASVPASYPSSSLSVK